jgi:hypothetical protein
MISINEYGYTLTEEAWGIIAGRVLDDHTPGELISHEYLRASFSIEPPDIADYTSGRRINIKEFIEAYNIYNFAYMSFVTKLRDILLDNHNYYLKNLRGEGYTLLPPQEQTEYAINKVKRDLQKIMKLGLRLTSNIRVRELSDDDKRKNSDAAAKLSSLRQLINI